MEKNIKLSVAGYYSITVINGDNIITINGDTVSTFTIDIEQNTTFKVQSYKYYGFTAIPKLRFYYSGGYIVDIVDFELTGCDTYELHPDFVQITPDNVNNILLAIECRTDKLYAYVQTNLTECTCNVNKGHALPVSTTFTVSCDSNREFQIIPSIGYTYGTEIKSEYMDKIDDCTYSKTITLIKGRDYIISGETVKKSTMLDKYPFTTAYRVSKDDLRELSIRRFIKPDLEPIKVKDTIVLYNIKDEYIDTAKYVVDLFRVNIPIATATKSRVYFGPYDMGIDCEVIDDDSITLDFGNVDIKGIYDNAIDYEHTEISIYLPYVGFIALSASDFMNKKVALKYQVNLMNGEGLVIISADNNPIITETCNVSVKIPYKLSDGEYVHTENDPNANYLIDSAPFLYVRTNNAIQPERLPYHDTNIYAVLGSLRGYTEATEISFVVKSEQITKTEIDEIKTLIASGIVI